MKKSTENDPTPQYNVILSDIIVSFVWVWSGSLIRYIAYRFLGLNSHHPVALIFKGSLAVLYLVFFARLRKATRGAYNPLMVICYGISGSFSGFIFIIFARIPAQVVGSIIAAWLIMLIFPEAAHPPHLNVDISQGTVIEGLLAFVIVTISLALKKRNAKRSATKTWIKSISKVVLHLLSTDVTGGMMNPAAAFGWAYIQGNYNTKEHLYVYWLAPIEATLLGVWTCTLFFQPKKQDQKWKTNSSLIQTEDFDWMDDHEGGLKTEKQHTSRPCESLDIQFCFSPRGNRSQFRRRRRRTLLYQNE